MNFEELSIEDKKDILNLETRKLLSIIDKINDEEYEYYNYEQYDLNENDLLHLKQRIDDFCKRTNSLYAKDILKNIKINDFVKIIPNDYYSMLKLLDKYKDEENFELKAFEETIR